MSSQIRADFSWRAGSSRRSTGEECIIPAMSMCAYGITWQRVVGLDAWVHRPICDCR